MSNEQRRQTTEDVDAVIDRMALTRVRIKKIEAPTRSDIYYPEWSAHTGVIDFYDWEHLENFISECEPTKDGYSQVEPYLFLKEGGAYEWTALYPVSERENPLGYEFCVAKMGDDYAAVERLDLSAIAAEIKDYAEGIAHFAKNDVFPVSNPVGRTATLLAELRDYADAQLEILEAWEDIDHDDEIVVTYQGKFHEKMRRVNIDFFNDGKSWAVGAIVKEFRKPLED